MNNLRLMSVMCVVCVVSMAQADTFVVPHVFDTPGFTFGADPLVGEATMFMGFDGGPGGGEATIHLFDDGGNPLLTPFGAELPPVTLPVPENGFTSVSLEQIYGQFGASSTVTGYAVVNTQGNVVNAFNDIGYFSGSRGPQFTNDLMAPVGTLSGQSGGEIPGTTGKAYRTLVFPHLLESSGGILDSENTFDTQLFVTYTAGQAGLPDGATGGATIDLFLFDENTGNVIEQLDGSPICAPCSFPMGTDAVGPDFDPMDTTISPRKRKINVDSLFDVAQISSDDDILPYLAIVVNGDADFVNLTGFVASVSSGPSELSVFVFEPQEIAVVAELTVPGEPQAIEEMPTLTYEPIVFSNFNGVEIPEPSSLLLMGFAGMVFGVRRQRR